MESAPPLPLAAGSYRTMTLAFAGPCPRVTHGKSQMMHGERCMAKRVVPEERCGESAAARREAPRGDDDY
jgi:hypothetical protein